MSNRQKQRAIANSTTMFDGMATIWMLPVVTLRHNIAYTDAREFFGIAAEEWKEKSSDAQSIFYLMEGSIVDVEIADGMAEDHPFFSEAHGLRTYVENRNGDFANNWEWFIAGVTSDVVYDLYEAYKETRRQIPKIESEILKEDAPDIETDPKDTGSGRKPTKKKSVSTPTN